MRDNRTVEQKLAAVEASMVMGGYAMTAQDKVDARRIGKGEASADEIILARLEALGFGESKRAHILRDRLSVKA
jgi:hypothetical protein